MSISTVALTAVSLIGMATVTHAANVTPDVIFGSGNANGSFTVAQTGPLELGLRAKLRYNLSGVPAGIYNWDGVDTYTFLSSDGVVPANRSIFNFEWSINTDFNDTGTPLEDSALDFQIDVDLDPTVNVGSVVSYDPFSPGGTGAYFGTNTTGNGAAAFNDFTPGDNVAQNSVNMGFGPISTPVRSGQYTISLSAFNSSSSALVSSTSINVIVDAPSPVPLPAALPLLLAGLGGLAFVRRRRDVAKV